ncbi:BQ2448_1711 [Microbotryum intermedium]|uniref:BQ2448_1711 protein n=1 Tax=Microbotryum intermedium TaxID=269621 RepID=A0A238FAX4_9BASI|nr:BQ2448_1711 [Microbotryum intermedium]
MSRPPRSALLFHLGANGSNTALSIGDLSPECDQDLHERALEQQLPPTPPLALHDRRAHCLNDNDDDNSDLVMHDSDEHRGDATGDSGRLALDALGLGLEPLGKHDLHDCFDHAPSDHVPTPHPPHFVDNSFSLTAPPNVASSSNSFNRSCAASQMPPSPPSPRRNLGKGTNRIIPAGCKEVPWVEEEDLTFWSPPRCQSDHALGMSTAYNHVGKQQYHDTTPPPLCPLASPPPSPHRKALSLPIAPPAPPAALAREPSSALKLKSTSSSSGGRRAARSPHERRSTSDNRGRGREPGSSLERRGVDRSPPRRASMGGSTKISKSMPISTCSLGRRKETPWPRPMAETRLDDPLASSSVVSSDEDMSPPDDDEDTDEYDARFVDLAVIRRSLSRSPTKPTSSHQAEAIQDGLLNDLHASASPPRRRRRQLQKLHSEQWFLFAVAGAKEQRTGLGYWSHFDLDLS